MIDARVRRRFKQRPEIRPTAERMARRLYRSKKKT
jgi:hypothetical protein